MITKSCTLIAVHLMITRSDHQTLELKMTCRAAELNKAEGRIFFATDLLTRLTINLCPSMKQNMLFLAVVINKHTSVLKKATVM